MKLRQVLSHSQSSESLTSRKHTPWISSPLDLKAMEDRSGDTSYRASEMKAGERVQEFGETPLHRSDSELLIFKSYSERSTIELFYDLFFVANLATFTANHEIVNADCEITSISLVRSADVRKPLKTTLASSHSSGSLGWRRPCSIFDSRRTPCSIVYAKGSLSG